MTVQTVLFILGLITGMALVGVVQDSYRNRRSRRRTHQIQVLIGELFANPNLSMQAREQIFNSVTFMSSINVLLDLNERTELGIRGDVEDLINKVGRRYAKELKRAA